MKYETLYNQHTATMISLSNNLSIRMPFIKRFGNSRDVNQMDKAEFVEWITEWMESEGHEKFKQDLIDHVTVHNLKDRISRYKLYLQGKGPNPYICFEQVRNEI